MDFEFQIVETGVVVKRKFEKICAPLMKRYDLRRVELDILHCITLCNEEHDMAHDILHMLHISKAHISKSVDNLSQNGFVLLKADSKDHRCVHLSLTLKGMRAVEEYGEVKREFTNELLSILTPQERTCLRSAFFKILKNVFDDDKENV